MPLLDFWKTSPNSVGELSIAQIVATAGDGNLLDSSNCSIELRDYLSNIPSEKIAAYVEQCLAVKFDRGGMVLQDLVNELGRRLDYKVKNGRYQGNVKDIGCDGIWEASEGNYLVIEVKTTDAYRISLDVVSQYRSRLIEQKIIDDRSSILIVVGRQDTGELEAQVRGSKHAWGIRLISAEALIKLVLLKENSDDQETGLKIRSVLTPLEYTRLDRLVDVMFTTATDAAPANALAILPDDEEQASDTVLAEKIVDSQVVSASAPNWEFTDPALLSEKRSKIIEVLARSHGTNLIKNSRALYWNQDHTIRVACTISKRYTKRPLIPYWYAHHPQWDNFLAEGSVGVLVLGCMDLDRAFAIPLSQLREILPKLNKTENNKTSYWHIHLSKASPDRYEIILPRSPANFDLTPFQIEIDK